jgi:hypothetical protein
VGANLVPELSVLLYGLVGPVITLNTGLSFDATPSSWSLGAPVSLTAKLSIPPLDLSSPELTVYDHTFPLTGGTIPNPTYAVPCTPPS